MKKSFLKTSLICLGITLLCGLYSFKTPYREKSQFTKGCVVETNALGECVSWKFRENYGHDEVRITNNCSSDIVVSYKYWTNRWVSVKFAVKAGTSSSWWPADNLTDFSYYFDD